MPRVKLNLAGKFALYFLGAYLVVLLILIVVRFIKVFQ